MRAMRMVQRQAIVAVMVVAVLTLSAVMPAQAGEAGRAFTRGFVVGAGSAILLHGLAPFAYPAYPVPAAPVYASPPVYYPLPGPEVVYREAHEFCDRFPERCAWGLPPEREVIYREPGRFCDRFPERCGWRWPH